ncbi:MAG: serine/threonine-protein kinase [Gemmatimonadales bacterium]|nr:serine/threonine-protein kinase [Gemmatimonadales bacterium]
MNDVLARLTTALADRYRIERELGHGGMATVYLAQDLRHHRRVAIKVLRPELAAVIGAERFLVEIRTTANLQHPHILPLFDSGTVDGTVYYVMPYVTGESLRDRLDRERQLAIPDAVRIASEVASALDYAHRQGVIHRDIKPENILLHDGRALVADFGIALAASRSEGGSRMTETGMSLGTPHYMSPEQAMGERDLDARTDVYALGCVLYEMLTGEPPFNGASAQAIVAKVMTEKPTAPTATRDTVPDHVEDAVLTALAKLPVDRFATAADFAAALRDDAFHRPRTSTSRAVATSHVSSRRVAIALGAVALGATALAVWALLRPAPYSGPAVFDVGLPENASMSFAPSASSAGPYGTAIRNLSISRNGEFAVYTTGVGDSTMLWYRSLQTGDVRPLRGTLGATLPRISPDGSEVAFLAEGQLRLVPIGGGDARSLGPAMNAGLGSWASDRQFLLVDDDGYQIRWIDPGSGTTRTKVIPRCAIGSHDPEAGELTCSFNGTAQVMNPESGEVWPIRTAQPDGTPGPPVSGTAFQVVDQKYLVSMAADGTLSAARYDAEQHLAYRSVSLLSGVRREPLGSSQFDISSNGTLLFAPGIDASIGHVVRVRPGQDPEALPLEAGDFQRYDLTTDGRWLTAVVQGAELNELRVYDLRDGQRYVWQRTEAIRHPIWSPDGQQILFGASDKARWFILRGSPGAGGAVDTVTRFAARATIRDTAAAPPVFDPIGWPADTIAVAQDWTGSVVVRFNPAVPDPTFDTVLTGARFASVSPNAKLVVYQASVGGRVVVTGFPNVGRQWQVASQGVEPLFLSSSEVLYRLGTVWFLARVNPDTGEPVGAATVWARDPRFSDTSGWSNRLSHDGGIIYVQSPDQASPTYLRVIPNWVSQMKRAVDAANK